MNLDPLAATAGRTCVAQVEELVEPGTRRERAVDRLGPAGEGGARRTRAA